MYQFIARKMGKFWYHHVEKKKPFDIVNNVIELCIEEVSNRLSMIIDYLTQTIMTDHLL